MIQLIGGANGEGYTHALMKVWSGKLGLENMPNKSSLCKIVRECFGYERIDQSLASLMNEIYRDYWNPLHNFFLPQMQLLSKERIGSRIKKKHDFPKTPFERLKLAPNVAEEEKAKLAIRMMSLNPFDLKRGLEQKLDLFFSLLKQGKSRELAA